MSRKTFLRLFSVLAAGFMFFFAFVCGFGLYDIFTSTGAESRKYGIDTDAGATTLLIMTLCISLFSGCLYLTTLRRNKL